MDRTLGEIISEYFDIAGEGESFMEYLIWGQTGFPYFWNIPADGNTPLECFRTQLAQAKWRLDNCQTLPEYGH